MGPFTPSCASRSLEIIPVNFPCNFSQVWGVVLDVTTWDISMNSRVHVSRNNFSYLLILCLLFAFSLLKLMSTLYPDWSHHPAHSMPSRQDDFRAFYSALNDQTLTNLKILSISQWVLLLSVPATSVFFILCNIYRGLACGPSLLSCIHTTATDYFCTLMLVIHGLWPWFRQVALVNTIKWDSPGERSLACLYLDLKPLPSLEEKYALMAQEYKDKGHKELSWPAEPNIDHISPSDPQAYKNRWLLFQHLGVTGYIAIANTLDTLVCIFLPFCLHMWVNVILSVTAKWQSPLDSSGIFQVKWGHSFQSDQSGTELSFPVTGTLS